jgi:osmoprotectant transport system substrate-binding protein
MPHLKITKTALILLTTFVVVIVSSFPAHACVGRKLVLGSLEDDRQGMVVRILSILIHERTGTTVEVKFFENREKLLKQVAKGKVDLYIDHVDAALARHGDKISQMSPKDRFRHIKKRFEEELNLIWLKPLGYKGRGAGEIPPGAAAVVVHKDTLKKFPALPRLLEKIGTKVVLDDKRLDSLAEKGKTSKPARVAREYLKEVKLI